MKLSLKKIVFMALYVSLFVVLSQVGTLNVFGAKVTLQNLPLYVASMTLGAMCAGIVGFCGSLISQLLSYGFSVTTLLWVLPHAIIGILLGFMFEKRIVKRFDFKFFVILIFVNVLLTILNTLVYYIDSIVYSYYNFVLIFGTFIIRLMVSVITAIVYGVILPPIVIIIKKIH